MKKNTLHAISFVALLTVIAKALGMLRDILQARAFGASAEMDLYTSANNFTVYIFSTAAYALCIAAVAVIGRRLSEGREQAEKCANGLISICLVFSAVVAVLLVVLGVAGVFGTDQQEAGRSFSWYMAVMSVSLPVIVLTYMFMALFQTLGHYSIQGSLSLLYNIVLCLVIFIFGKSMTVPQFAVCMSAAWLLQFAVVVPFFFSEKYRFRFSVRFKNPDNRAFLKTAAATLFTTSAFLLCYLSDSAQSAHIESGTVSSFFYADKLFTPVVTTVIYSISAVMFPKWSEKSKTMAADAYGRYIGKAVENTVMFMLPVSAVVAAFGTPIVTVLFEGGSFDSHSAQVTGMIFSCYALGMVGFALLDLFAKAYYACDKTKEPMLVNIAVVAANAVLNYILMSLGASAYAAAAGTAVLMTAGGAVLACLFCRKNKGVFSFARIIKSTVMSALVFGALFMLSGIFTDVSDSKIMLIIKCGIMGIAALAVYVLVMRKELTMCKKDGGRA